MSIESNIQSQESTENNHKESADSSVESEPEELEEPDREWVRVGIDKTKTEEGNENSFFANNGILAYTTEGGAKFIAPNSDERVQDLQEKGYEFNSGLGVPFSNESFPDGSKEQQRWQTKFGSE